MIIAITGTPGTGKTYIAKRLAQLTGMDYFDMNNYIKNHKLYDSYDRSARTYDVNITKLKVINKMFRDKTGKNKYLDRLVGKSAKIYSFITALRNKSLSGIIIDGHLSHYINSDYCIVVQSDLKRLSSRLEARKYPKQKLQDNIDSEIFGVCLDEARLLNRKVILIEN